MKKPPGFSRHGRAGQHDRCGDRLDRPVGPGVRCLP